MNRHERRAAARTSQKAQSGEGSTASRSQAANAPGTGDPAALYEAGLAHMRAGRQLEAQLCCRQALAADANHADTLHLMGLLSLHASQRDHAVEWIARAIRQDPRPEYLASLGTALQQQARYAEALQAFDKAVQLKPANAELWKQLGDVLVQMERFDQALLSYQHVLELNPDHPDALYKSGALLNQFGRYAEAMVQLDLGNQVLPDHAPTLQARARTLHNLKRFDEAIAEGKRAHRLDPGNAETCNNIGAALRLLGRDQEALEWFDKALDLRPGSVETLNNKIISLYGVHRFDEIFALYDRMKSLGLNNATTEWNVSLAHLLTGNLEAGWPGHEVRLQLPSSFYPKFPQPIWLGEQDIEGKTVLICADEGLGDTIQFARYAPMLGARGARVVLAVQAPLQRLLAGLSGVAQCIPMSAVSALPAFDCHCPVSSLPLAFATRLDTIPSATPYLPAPATGLVQAWEDRLGPHSKLRVGLVWSGSPGHSNDVNRSISLRSLSRILDVDASFVSLQTDPRPDDKAQLGQTNIVDLTAHLTDFAETAALVSCLDLVITVDTSVAHLAGALGRPTWILLPWTPDYRWLLDREDSPWYPTVRLFRQTEARDYATVLERVRSELLALIPGNGAG
jgi:tetratricopeptide (TPR) repeat protein